EERVDERAVGRGRVVVARIALAQRGRVGHEPASVGGDRGGADFEGGQTRGVERGRRHQPRGKFIASTKICSKSGCAASETCSIRPAIVSARARSASESRHSCAPREAAFPTYRTRETGK